MLFLKIDDPALTATSDLESAHHQLSAYQPTTAEQAEVLERFLDFLARHPENAHRRSCLEGHLTASALVVEAGTGKVLLTHHRKLGRWLQLGGHCDGDANLPAVALREAIEESGIADLEVAPEIVDLDIHPIPARPGEPEHLHLDARFLVRATPGAVAARNHESHELRWLAPAGALELGVDASVERLLPLAARVA